MVFFFVQKFLLFLGLFTYCSVVCFSINENNVLVLRLKFIKKNTANIRCLVGFACVGRNQLNSSVYYGRQISWIKNITLEWRWWNKYFFFANEPISNTCRYDWRKAATWWNVVYLFNIEDNTTVSQREKDFCHHLQKKKSYKEFSFDYFNINRFRVSISMNNPTSCLISEAFVDRWSKISQKNLYLKDQLSKHSTVFYLPKTHTSTIKIKVI